MAYPTKKKWNGYKGKAPVVRVPYKPIATPSDAQLNIFDYICNGDGNLVVDAKAGTGKTATIVEAMYRMNPRTTAVYVVFNNRNAREAEAKVPSHVTVKTCHALGWMALKAAFELRQSDIDDKGEKSEAIVRALVGPDDEKTELRYNLTRAISLAKCYLSETISDVCEIVAKHGIETCKESDEEFAGHVLKGLELSLQQYRRVNFDDMIWLPIKMDIAIPQWDNVFVDECQDLNAARIELVNRAVKKNGRIFSVGDPKQAIYGFCGADKDAVGNIIERTSATVLPLNITYRCGKSIVALAQTVVPEYEAYEKNADGKVEAVSETYMVKNAQPGDFILSRTNAPLVPMCLQFLKEGRKANIQGRDMGRNLIYMIKRSEAQDVDSFLTWLANWKETECARLAAKNRDCTAIVDKAECLEAFCEGAHDLAQVKKNIEAMFDDIENDMARIMLSTVHKAKGLERHRVWMLTKTFKEEKGGEEANIWYVAVTRAKSELYLVSAKGEEETSEEGLSSDEPQQEEDRDDVLLVDPRYADTGASVNFGDPMDHHQE